MTTKIKSGIGYIRCQGVLYWFHLKPAYHRTDQKKHGATDNRPVFRARVVPKETKR